MGGGASNHGMFTKHSPSLGFSEQSKRLTGKKWSLLGFFFLFSSPPLKAESKCQATVSKCSRILAESPAFYWDKADLWAFFFFRRF